MAEIDISDHAGFVRVCHHLIFVALEKHYLKNVTQGLKDEDQLVELFVLSLIWALLDHNLNIVIMLSNRLCSSHIYLLRVIIIDRELNVLMAANEHVVDVDIWVAGIVIVLGKLHSHSFFLSLFTSNICIIIR